MVRPPRHKPKAQAQGTRPPRHKTCDPAFTNETGAIYSALFYGLASDGTVGANKNSIAIIGEKTDNNVQAYFVYDSKKAGTVTTSHLRFGSEPIRSPYLVSTADFIACHNFTFLEKCDMLSRAKEGATFLLCSLYDKDAVWDRLPVEVQEQIIGKKLRFYVIDAVNSPKDWAWAAASISSCRRHSSAFPT